MKASNYLLLAAFVTGGLLLGGCDRYAIHDYRADSDWLYVNESSHDLKIFVAGFEHLPDIEENIDLPAGESRMVTSRADSRKKGMTAEDFTTPYHLHNAVIEIEGLRYVIHRGEFFVETANHKAEKLGENYFGFTYTFTDAIIGQILATYEPQPATDRKEE